MIKAINLSKSFGGQRLFDEVNFSINPCERVGLVGRNGHGKTTLLRIIIGEEQPDAGGIVIPKNYRIGYVSQQLMFTEENVLEEACRGLPEHAHGETWTAEKILSGLGFGREDMKRPWREFSGGYQVRLSLARTLVSEPNLLLLDEPTNYLDVVAIRWLEKFLRQWRGEMIIVTHDRSFMDTVVTHIMGIHRRKIRKIEGNTVKYYDQILKEEEIYEKTRINDEKKRKEVELFISRFRAKARLAGLVQSRIKALQKQERLERLEKIKSLDFAFNYCTFSAKTLMSVDNLSFSYGSEPLIENLRITIGSTDRICVIGRNGRGKTTLLRLLAGELTPRTGTIHRHGDLAIGYFAQTNVASLNDTFTVEQEILSVSGDRQRARDIAAAMMFEGDDALKPVGVLSGGEKSRVLLGKVLASPCNLLLLDEPTNHLDMESNDALLAAVDQFEGAVIIVTHNEMFLHALANRFIVFQGGGVSVFEGTYQRFLEKVGWEDERAGMQPMQRGRPKEKEDRRRRAEILSRRTKELAPLKQRVAEIESSIEAKEKRLAAVNGELITVSGIGSGETIARLSKEAHALRAEIDALYDNLESAMDELERKSEEFNRLADAAALDGTS